VVREQTEAEIEASIAAAKLAIKIHRRKAKLGARRERGVKSAHNRWHRARGMVNPDCPLCQKLLSLTSAEITTGDVNSNV
jgi:hypothetical protein